MLAAQWRVLDDEEKALTSKITNLASGAVGANDTMATTISAMRELLAELSLQIANAIVQTTAAR